MISYKQYKLLKSLYKLTPMPSSPQKYSQKFINEIENISNLNEYTVISLINSLDGKYVTIVKNDDGYIHCAAITCDGVFVYKNYFKNLFFSFFRNIILPALVSITCSLIILA